MPVLILVKVFSNWLLLICFAKIMPALAGLKDAAPGFPGLRRWYFI